MKLLALAIIAVGLIFLGNALLSPKDQAEADLRDRFAIRAVVNGEVHEASALCEGDIVGTGYLGDQQSSFDACTFDKDVVVHQYLQQRATCDDVKRVAATLPDRALGRVTITGVYFDQPLTLQLDATTGRSCDEAAWKLLGPLLPR